MKKLFTLFALLTCFLGANAVEIEDYTADFTQKGTSTIGWKDGAIQDDWISADADGVHFFNPEAMENWYTYQLWLIGSGIPTETDVDYTVTFVAKVSEGTATVRCKIGDWNGGFSDNVEVNSTEYKEYTFSGKAATTGAGFFIQFGDYVGTLSFKSFKVTHEGKESKPVEWYTVEGMTNGDAETAWPAWALAEEGGINANWRGDRTKEICAWALTMGRNYDDQCPADINGDSYRARPFPADIEVDPDDANNHVFAVHVTQIADIVDGGDGSIAWSNQFWIQSPQTYKAGTQVRVKFRCKAEKTATVPTQLHKIYPSNYLNSNGIGDIEFSTEWQTIEKEATWAEDGWSIAFNLTNSNREPNVYYFDDLSFELMKLEEGWFVASSNTTTGIDYDYDTATEFVYDEETDAYVATVGTEGKKDTWVNEVMISTVRGNDKAFKGATIKPSNGTIKTNDPDNWQDYVAGSNAKIKLPAAGVWKIFVAPSAEGDGGQILFMQLEGDAAKEPVNIVTNTTEFVINATERDWKPAKDDGTPADGEEGIGTGQPWDNQFWIAANRDLAKDEVTVLKFKYKSSIDAKVSTQAHKYENGMPCSYLNWQGINNMSEFKAGDWQEYNEEFTVPAGDDGMRSIVFNLSEIKGACDYYITDVQWYLKYDEEGKTLENLINADNTENFWIKIHGVNNNNPYQYGTDPTTGISNVVNKVNTGSAVIYNLAGQRVSKDYKGIVVKNGKKVVVK